MSRGKCVARKTREDSEKTRQSIMDAAETVFLAKGLAMATMADIADTAGISRGAVYGHYKNKQEVALALCSRAFQEVSNFVPTFEPPWSEQLLALTMMFLRRASKCSSSERVLEILYLKVEQHEENKPLLRRRDLFEKSCKRLTRRLLRQAINNGELPSNLDVKMANTSLHVLYHGICLTMLWHNSADAIDWNTISRLVTSWGATIKHCPQFLLQNEITAANAE